MANQPQFQEVGVLKRKKEGFNSRLPIPSIFRKGHTKQSPSQPLPSISYPRDLSSSNLLKKNPRGQSVDLRPQPSQPQPKPARKSFDLDLRPRRFAFSSKQPDFQLKENLPSSTHRLPRKSLGDSPTSPTVLLVERHNLKTRTPLPTFPESEETQTDFKQEDSIDSLPSFNSSSSSSTESTTPTNQSNDMAIFPSFGSNNQSNPETVDGLNAERLIRQRSVSQNSLTRKFSDEAKRLLGGNREKSRERNTTAEGVNFGLDGKALKRSSKTKDYDLRSHFLNPVSPIETNPSEKSTLKDYEHFPSVKAMLKSPTKGSRRPGSSDSNSSNYSAISSSNSSDLTSDSSTSPRKGRSTHGRRSRTTSSPILPSSATPPPRCSSRSSSRRTAYGMGMNTSPIRTESGHGEESISPSKTKIEHINPSLIRPSSSPTPSPSPSKNSGLQRPLLGSWLCDDEEEEDTSLQIILSTHRRSSSECSFDVLDRRNLASNFALQQGKDSNTFIFPSPPKTLKERHSHCSLRSSVKVQNFRRNHSGGSGPVPTFGSTSSNPISNSEIKTSKSKPKPTVAVVLESEKSKLPISTSNSALRERRAKPPLVLSLESCTFPSSENRSRTTSASSSNSNSLWSPPPCPPPSTPLPELPSTNMNGFQFDRHSRSSSSNNPSPSSSGILRNSNTRPRSKTFSSSHQIQRSLLFDLNPPRTTNSSSSSSFELENDLQFHKEFQKKRVSFNDPTKDLNQKLDYSNLPLTSSSTATFFSSSSEMDEFSRPSSSISWASKTSKRNSSNWSSPITPGFASNLMLDGNGIGIENEEIEISKDDQPQLLCALVLEGFIKRNSQFKNPHQKNLDDNLSLLQGDQSLDSNQDDEIVYGFAI